VSHDDDGIISQVTVDALNEEIRQHRAIQHDLRTRVEWLIDQIGWSEEGCFTFPDGETWWKEPSE
jgi:hypothetical protein